MKTFMTATLLAISTTAFANGSNELDNLTILECTHIFNLFTHFQVSLEIPLEDLQPRNHHLDLAQINQDTGFPTIQAIVTQDPDYYAAISNNTIHILYKNSSLTLNHVLSDFTVHGDLVDAFLLLRQEIPAILLRRPFFVGGKTKISSSPPVWKELPPSPYEHQTYGGQIMSIHFTDTTALNALTQILQTQTNHMYWVAEDNNTNVFVSFFSQKDNMGEQTIQAHDPELMERIRHAQEEREKESEQSHGQQLKQ